jgi:hypothetical protein
MPGFPHPKMRDPYIMIDEGTHETFNRSVVQYWFATPGNSPPKKVTKLSGFFPEILENFPEALPVCSQNFLETSSDLVVENAEGPMTRSRRSL